MRFYESGQSHRLLKHIEVKARRVNERIQHRRKIALVFATIDIDF